MKIVMVCLGNICRSPLADGLLRKKAASENLNIIVDSAGTSGLHAGEAPDLRMQKTAADKGTPIGFLRARQFQIEDFDTFDIIYAMDQSNQNTILRLARTESDKTKVKLILNEIQPGSDLEVPDPYYGGQQGFENVYTLLDKATDRIIEKIKNG